MSEQAFVWTQWAALVTQLTNQYPDAAARSLIDILNEPDAFKLQWQAQNGLPGAGDLYIAAMDAIYPVNQGMISSRKANRPEVRQVAVMHSTTVPVCYQAGCHDAYQINSCPAPCMRTCRCQSACTGSYSP